MGKDEPGCSVTVQVHPLVALNISEHWTRARVADKNESQVWGVILGVRESRGQVFEAINSFDFQVTRTQRKDGKTVLSNLNLQQRIEQYKEVFPELDFLGWYTTAAVGDQNEVLQLPKESIVLQLSPFTKMPANKLPLVAYKVGDDGTLNQVEWTLLSEASERIGVEHVTRLSKLGNEAGVSAVSRHLRSEVSVIEMMSARLRSILHWLESVELGTIQFDPVIAREAAKVAAMAEQIKPANKDFDRHISTHLKDVNFTLLLSKIATLLGQDYHTSVDALRLRDTQSVPVDVADGDDSFFRPLPNPKRIAGGKGDRDPTWDL